MLAIVFGDGMYFHNTPPYINLINQENQENQENPLSMRFIWFVRFIQGEVYVLVKKKDILRLDGGN